MGCQPPGHPRVVHLKNQQQAFGRHRDNHHGRVSSRKRRPLILPSRNRRGQSATGAAPTTRLPRSSGNSHRSAMRISLLKVKRPRVVATQMAAPATRVRGAPIQRGDETRLRLSERRSAHPQHPLEAQDPSPQVVGSVGLDDDIAEQHRKVSKRPSRNTVAIDSRNQPEYAQHDQGNGVGEDAERPPKAPCSEGRPETTPWRCRGWSRRPAPDSSKPRPSAPTPRDGHEDGPEGPGGFRSRRSGPRRRGRPTPWIPGERTRYLPSRLRKASRVPRISSTCSGPPSPARQPTGTRRPLRA